MSELLKDFPLSESQTDLHKKQAKIFAQQPQFVRQGLYFQDILREIRHQQIMQKYFAADLLKLQGNLRFKNQDFEGACRYYEQSLAIFRYVKIKQSSKDIEDDTESTFEYFDDNGKTEKEKRFVKGLKVILYQNISIVYLKLSNKKGGANLIEDAYLACTEAIKLDLKGSKAHYLRAKTRLHYPNLDIEDYKLSIKDLKRALEFDNQNQTILEELKKCQELFQIMKLKEQEQEKQVKESKKRKQSLKSEKNGKESEGFWNQFKIQQHQTELNQGMSFYENTTTEKISQEIQELEEFINLRSQQILKSYEKNGNLKQVELLNEQLNKSKQDKIHLEKVARLDLSRPDPELIEIAKKYDIDLNDEKVQQKFQNIKEQNAIEVRRWLKNSGFNSNSEQEVYRQSSLQSQAGGQLKALNETNNIQNIQQQQYSQQEEEFIKQSPEYQRYYQQYHNYQDQEGEEDIDYDQGQAYPHHLLYQEQNQQINDYDNDPNYASLTHQNNNINEDIDSSNYYQNNHDQEDNLLGMIHSRFSEEDLKLLQSELLNLINNCNNTSNLQELKELANKLSKYGYEHNSSNSCEEEEEEEESSKEVEDNYPKQSIQSEDIANSEELTQNENKEQIQSKNPLSSNKIGIAITAIGLVIFLSFFSLFLEEVD